MAARFVTITFAAVTLFMAYAATKASQFFWPLWFNDPLSQPFIWGAITGTIFGIIIWKFFSIILVLEHEFTHFITAIALLRRPIRIVAGDDGGEVVYQGRGSTLICLAPYFLPTFTVFSLAIQPLIQMNYQKPVILIIGLTWGYHFSTGIIESHPKQSDLRRGGLLASYLAVTSMMALLYPMTAFAAVLGWSSVKEWMIRAWTNIQAYLM